MQTAAANIFDKIVANEYANDTRLGLPSADNGHHSRRLNAMAIMRGWNGFRTPAKEPKKDAQGMTRGDRRRAARAAANARVSEERSYLYMHSAARRLLLTQQVLAA
ncbi:hypothetical protein EHS39_11730 [Ensifer sp. MPMI2T]|nr:hypothetical protein EHS39_11730 [Ensifer sp. MPMI2T]